MEECIFCKIIKNEIPSKRIYEDNDVIAFLDINPANPGHTLVVPKKHSENIFTTDDETLKKTITVVKNLSTSIKEKMNAKGLNVLQNNGQYAGQIVSHVHFHIIPRYENDNVVISYKRAHMTPEQFEEIARKLSSTEKKKSYDDFFNL